ncbi:Saccharopine dehydrogenase [Rubrivivax sp. A210]|uniref:saccharopine dehydrogenase family protein n=1 Tax=Rubrivivax sp. A210 TaxID=2772301 RepID=UPI00191A5D24|nr:saccharopine dehydrogenase NADP-binding domain-containing protein [Rubrivivax sp. A210]CAD5372446.1 Saccharopine dehydrogenase [Rubrivivax sp. A210]
MRKPFDLILFGASGYTGRLVAEVLQQGSVAGAGLSWALAGRDVGRLGRVRDGLPQADHLPLLAADAADGPALAKLVRQADVVISTVGPYQQHGEPLVTACAEAGVDYVDLCGEPGWMARMIPRLEPLARASGARIVFSCGFDSVPFDLGVVYLQDEALQRLGVPLQRLRCRVRTMKGGPSGGTVESLLATMEQMRRDPATARTMADPFALTPGFFGPPQPDDEGAACDERGGAWTAPFVMAPINTKNVHRTNALRGHPWGRDFVYDERMLAGTGQLGEMRARRLARQLRIQNALLAFAPTRAMLRRFALPRPGEGPSAQEREAGHYEIVFSGETADGRSLGATVTGDRDPGYGSTARMVAASALCLMQDIDRIATPGGVWTAGAAMGLALVRRLQAHAGLAFSIDDGLPPLG